MSRSTLSLATIVAAYGYPVVVLGAMIEGESVLIAAGYLAHRHHLELWKVIACAAAGGTVGDQAFFFLGRAYGERLVARLPKSLRERAARGRASVQANPVRVLLAMRFLYGMRIVLPILCGASTMSVSRYVRYNLATAIVWATLFAGVGFLFGAAAQAALKEIERFEAIVLIALVGVVVAVHLGSGWLRHRAGATPKDPH